MSLLQGHYPRANGAKRGLLILLTTEFKVDDGDEMFSVRWSSLILILWRTIAVKWSFYSSFFMSELLNQNIKRVRYVLTHYRKE